MKLGHSPSNQDSTTFPEGMLVCLKTGGPLMTVENIRDDGIVATVWFLNGVVCRDAFHPQHLNAFVPAGLSKED